MPTAMRLPVIASVVAAGALVAAGPATAARVSLLPASGPAGTKVTLAGAGFTATKEVTIKAGNQVLVRTRTTSHGAFTATATIPARASGSIQIATGKVHNVF